MVENKKFKNLTLKQIRNLKIVIDAFESLGISTEDLEILVKNKEKIINTLNDHTVALTEIERNLNKTDGTNKEDPYI